MTKGDRIPEIALDRHRGGAGAAVATVIETWGSAPRPAGAQLAISGAGEMAGSVSGGCVEGAVAIEAMEALEDGRCRLLDYGVDDGDAFAAGLACGGAIRILVEPVGIGGGWAEDTLADLVARRAGREAAGVVTDLETFDRRIVGPEFAPEAFAADRSGFTDESQRRFLAVHNPPPRLAVVGAVHIAQPLVAMARAAGYDCTIIDPRAAFGSQARFPGERLLDKWPDEALAEHGLDSRTAVVTLTHDPKLDDPALRAAIASPAFYIGALGSTRTHAKRVARLIEAGATEREIARIDAPVGLDIGARSPAEIAAAITAEMTLRLRRPDTQPGSRADGPKVAAILLAAGASRRMGGRDKSMEPVDGEPLIRRMVRAALDSAAARVVVVLRAEDPRGAALDGLNPTRVVNPRAEEGMGTSIAEGVRALGPEIDAALILPTDMPEIGAEEIDRLIAGFDPKAGREIVRATAADGRPGHPVVFGRRFFEPLAGLDGDRGAREILRDHPGFVAEIALPGEAALTDLDTERDWDDWRKRRRRRGG